jgi:MtN3 and saliva related transmembrane protein
LRRDCPARPEVQDTGENTLKYRPFWPLPAAWWCRRRADACVIKPTSNRKYAPPIEIRQANGSDLSLIPLPAPVVDLIGNAGAILTTVCWLPQAIKIIRDRETRALSLPTNLAFTLGMILWLLYGMALPDWPLIWSSAITLAFMLVIVALKIRYG